jgi:hypothetical protein
MRGIQISYPALDAIQRGFEQAPELTERELLATMTKVTMILEGQVKDAMPKRTGLTAGSVTSDAFSVPGGVLGVVGSASPVALFIEEGTKPHEIRAINAKALSFPFGVGPLRPGGSFGSIFVKSVHHPGTKAQHIFANTLAGHEGDVIREFEDAAWRIADAMTGGAAA